MSAEQLFDGDVAFDDSTEVDEMSRSSTLEADGLTAGRETRV